MANSVDSLKKQEIFIRDVYMRGDAEEIKKMEVALNDPELDPNTRKLIEENRLFADIVLKKSISGFLHLAYEGETRRVERCPTLQTPKNDSDLSEDDSENDFDCMHIVKRFWLGWAMERSKKSSTNFHQEFDDHFQSVKMVCLKIAPNEIGSSYCQGS